MRGYFHLFLAEGNLLRPLLESVESRLKDKSLSAFVKRLFEAIPKESARGRIKQEDEAILSEREIEVLRQLAVGQS